MLYNYNRSYLLTGMNIISEEILWMNNVDKDKIESVRDTLNEEIRRRKNDSDNQ